MIESDKFLLILPVKQRKSSVLYHELAYRAAAGRDETRIETLEYPW